MKIVFLADAPYVHTRRWVDHFVALGYECHVISFRPAEIPGANVHYIGGAEVVGKARYLIHARRVKALVRKLQPDIVHALHLTSYGFLGALAGVHPYCISVWGTDILEAPSLTPFHRWITRYALRHADSITATGLHLATETTRYAPKQAPVTVVPYGVDLGRFASKWANGQMGKEPDGRVVIGTAARLSPEKGLTYLIDALVTLRERYGDRVKLRIAGEGPEEAKLKAQVATLGLGNLVEFAGWLEHDRLPEFLQELDVFALPSTWEGFGVAAAEASACGLPVVATDVYGIPDVVRPNVTGLLVPPKDPTALAKALGRLIDNPELRSQFGRAGREYVASHYDWRDNARQMESIYASLVARAPVGAAS